MNEMELLDLIGEVKEEYIYDAKQNKKDNIMYFHVYSLLFII